MGFGGYLADILRFLECDVSFEFDYTYDVLYLHKYLLRIKQLVADSLGYLKGCVTVDLIRKLSRVLKSEMKFLET